MKKRQARIGPEEEGKTRQAQGGQGLGVGVAQVRVPQVLQRPIPEASAGGMLSWVEKAGGNRNRPG